MGGRNKRKVTSPLQKGNGKSRRTDEEEAASEEEGSRNQNDWNVDIIADLKQFIQRENARSNRSLAEEIRKTNDERISALESSLSFALTASETMA